MNVNDAIIVALENTGIEIIEEDYDGFIVGMSNNDVMFIEPQVHIGEIVEEVEVHHSRFDFEKASCMFLVDNDVGNHHVLFNIAQMFVLSPDRGMLRHVVNWTSDQDIKCRWDIVMLEGSE